jgi:SAM-dependent methyltransferase
MSWDPVWDDVFKRQAWGKYPGEDLIRFVARNFYHTADRSQVKLLEVGCGPGANLWYLAREGFSVYGIDGSMTALTLARERLDRECPGWLGGLICGDISQLPFVAAYFDGVIDNEAVYANAFDVSKTIYSEMSRVTRPGGRLFSRTFASGCWGDGTGEQVGHNSWLVSEGPLQEKGYSRFTEFDEIEMLCLGFKIHEVELLTRSHGGLSHDVKEWLITGVRCD